MEEVTTREAAKILGVSKSSIDLYCRAGLLPYRMVVQTRLIPLRAVKSFKKPRGKPGPKPGRPPAKPRRKR